MDPEYPDPDPRPEMHPDARRAGENVPRWKSRIAEHQHQRPRPHLSFLPSVPQAPIARLPPSSSSSSPSSTFFLASFSTEDDLDSDCRSRETGNRFFTRDEAWLCGTDRHLISSSAFFGGVVVTDDTKTLVTSSLLSISFSSSAASWPMHVTFGDDGSSPPPPLLTALCSDFASQTSGSTAPPRTAPAANKRQPQPAGLGCKEGSNMGRCRGSGSRRGAATRGNGATARLGCEEDR